nr:hypothetical protein [Tanacetum cinerariifolium]
MVNVIPPDHVDNVPVVEPNQHADVSVVPEPILEDPLNPPSPASESEPKDVNEAKNSIEHEDETVPNSVHEVGESSTVPFLHEDSDGLLPGHMRRDINSLFGQIASLLRRLVEQRMAAMEKLIEKLGNVEDKRDLYWTRVQDHEFYQEMIHREFVFEERPNEAINVLIEDKKSPSSEPRGSPHDA